MLRTLSKTKLVVGASLGCSTYSIIGQLRINGLMQSCVLCVKCQDNASMPVCCHSRFDQLLLSVHTMSIIRAGVLQGGYAYMHAYICMPRIYGVSKRKWVRRLVFMVHHAALGTAACHFTTATCALVQGPTMVTTCAHLHTCTVFMTFACGCYLPARCHTQRRALPSTDDRLSVC